MFLMTPALFLEKRSTSDLHPVVQAGDAVFIPEGWWHQIDSTDISIAVNFWWQSPFGAGLQVLPCLACKSQS
jgi:Cupin-like domain